MCKKSDVVVLLSGGIDSTACIPFYVNQDFSVTALFCDYGQVSLSQELPAVTAIADFYNIELNIVKCDGLPQINGGEIVSRNALLLNLALFFIQKKPALLALGIHSGTHYIDCGELFLTKMQSIFDLYTDGRVIITAPFISWTKKEIWDYCIFEKAPLNLTYSCELGKKQPCGVCSSCKDLEVLYAG